MLIVRSIDKMVKSIKNLFNSEYAMKNKNLADVIQGIKITRTSSGHIFSQFHYVVQILERSNKNDTKEDRTSVDPNQLCNIP